MKKIALFFFTSIILITSCNKIPDKSVSEKLSIKELAKAIKSDTSFSSFYENIRKKVDEMDDIKKAKYNDVTYRRLFKFVKYSEDTLYWNPLVKGWENEWETKFGIYTIKADSVIEYWKEFLDENSLDKYVKIELAEIDKEYYEYIGELKEVNLGFRLTPLLGPIEQVRFNYGYKAKINGDTFYDKHNCILTSPFSVPVIRYWEVGYSDKNSFAGKSVETFLRDYNLEIEISAIRKDGINLSSDDYNIPEEVSDYLNYGTEEFMGEYYKVKIIKNFINKDYIEKWEYTFKKANEIRENQDKLCFDFLNELYND